MEDQETTLALSGEPITTVFDLLGRREDDITYALGWALAESPEFLRHFLGAAGVPRSDPRRARIDLQRVERREGGTGRTDIEI